MVAVSTRSARPARVVAIDLDAVLGDTRPLWRAWLEDAHRVLELDGLPEDRAAAAAELDRRGGNWRTLLRRFAEDHAAVHLRRDGAVNASLRRLKADGARIVAVTDAPAELAEVALAQLGATRYVDAVEGDAQQVIRNRSEL
jgi:phosphoglycolate phosphatase-like HAD superfamily hydrolase